MIAGGNAEALRTEDLQHADDLGRRYSADATWQSHIAAANAFRQMETTNGALRFPELRDSPARLLGKVWHENSSMDVITP